MKVPKAKSSRKMCKKLLKNKVLLEKTNDVTQKLSEMLDELSIDDCDTDDEEDLALQNELADYREELLKTLPLAPMSDLEWDSTEFTETGSLKNPTDGSN